MSSMLEQAIIDAETLRETALKNAESVLVEKYQDQIKEAVNALLEQDEEDPLADPIVDEMPLAATDGEVACPCPDETEEVDINLGDLMQQMSDDPNPGQPASQEELAGELGSIEERLMEKIQREFDNVLNEEDEVLDLEEQDLLELTEKLRVDATPVKSGWAGTPQAVLDEAEEAVLAQEQDTDAKEARKDKNEALASIQNEVKTLHRENGKLIDVIEETKLNEKKLLEAIETLKTKFDEMSLLNAKLLYKNRTFTNDSLNERQKQHIVETLSKANSVEEAKTIYETLQNTVDSTSPKKKQSESLSETVNRTSSTLLLSKSRRAADNKKESPSYVNRWKTLAGLE